MTAIALVFVGFALLSGAGPDKVRLVQCDKVLEGWVVFEGQDEIRVQFGKDRFEFADLSKRQASWKESFELSSTHFVRRVHRARCERPQRSPHATR